MPVGINLPADLVTTIHDVEEKSLKDAVNTNYSCNGISTCVEENHVQSSQVDTVFVNSKKLQRKTYGNGINFVKLLQGGAKRSTSTASNSKSESALVIKTVEIVRKPNEILGIFIKKKKVSIEAVQPYHTHKRNGNAEIREGVFVSKLEPSCLAAKQSLLSVGDEILAVNTIHVGPLDIKMVAAMMSQLQRLIVTVQTVQMLPKSPSIRDKKSFLHLSNRKVLKQSGKGFSNQKRKKSTTSLASLPEEDVFDHVSNAKPSKNGEFLTLPSFHTGPDIKHSVYDNNYPVELPNVDSAKKTIDNNNLIQSRFDESVQILLDAIANCDKVSSRNASENEDLNSNLPFSSHSSASSRLNDEDLNSSSDKDSLLSEILQTVENGSFCKTYMGLQPENLSQGGNVLLSNDYDELESPVETELATLSSASSTQEMNLDDVVSSLEPMVFKTKLEHSQSFNPEVSTGFGVNSKSADTVKFFSSEPFEKGVNRQLPHNHDFGKHHASDSDISQTFQPNLLTSGSDKVFFGTRMYSKNVPKFPVSLTHVPVDVITMIEPLISKPHDHCNVTVDKKREWFNSGGLVSEELKKRIDGESNDKMNIGSTATNSQKPPNYQV